MRKDLLATFFAIIVGLPILFMLFSSEDNTETFVPNLQKTNDIEKVFKENSADILEQDDNNLNEQEIRREEVIIKNDTSSKVEVEETSPPTNSTANSTSKPTLSNLEKWYTSSHYSAQYYYHESCDGWEQLSSRYLQSYTTEVALQSAHPAHILHPDCTP